MQMKKETISHRLPSPAVSSILKWELFGASVQRDNGLLLLGLDSSQICKEKKCVCVLVGLETRLMFTYKGNCESWLSREDRDEDRRRNLERTNSEIRLGLPRRHPKILALFQSHLWKNSFPSNCCSAGGERIKLRKRFLQLRTVLLLSFVNSHV